MFSRILLFDIDGTLLLSGRAGYRALNRAFEELFRVARGFDDIPVAGMTRADIADLQRRAHATVAKGIEELESMESME